MDISGGLAHRSYAVNVDSSTSRLSHNDMDDRFAARLSFRRLSLPVDPTADISRYTDRAHNAISPTSMGNNQVRQPLWLQASILG
ncbi:hypothetical protein DPMN_082920 [Dreissena polymorpha]|uniref:Uncharacterized protein n=1 Tax=Dreissena polymorpha TaxID=45954 RepID=A0A9D3YBP2_DREPO|nr:hypothetical protein DPMN_082920 [Dreissena polymorpha]